MDEPGADEPRMLAGRYRLIEQIGRGGMGIVWRAVDTLLDREAAVKEVHVPSSLPEEARGELYQRTLREARTAARLRHPNVVTLFDVVEEDDRPWIVMELVHARALDDVVAAEGPMPPERAARIGGQVLAALTAAHGAGVLHRDVKPANVLVGEGDRVTLTDFGIATIEGDASITQSGQLVGSPAYLAPERAAGEPVGTASDLWSLGATLFMTVEGRGPFDRDAGPMATLGAVLTQEAPPAPHAGPLAPVIGGLLVRDPAQRLSPEHAAEMLDGIASGQFATGDRPAAPPVAAPMPAPTTVDTPMPVGGEPGAYGLEPVQYGAPSDATGPYGPPGAGGTGPQGPYGYGPERRRSRTPLVIGGVVAAVLLVGLGAGLVSLYGLHVVRSADAPVKGSPMPVSSFTRPTRGKASPAGPTTGRPKIPAGFVRHKDPSGFSVSLPKGWGDRVENGNSVIYYSPDHSAYLLVDRTAQPTGNPMVNMRRFIKDARRDGKYKNSRTLSLRRLRYLNAPAAAWEFTWQLDNNATVHAEDRQVVKPDGDFVAVYWQTYDRSWAAGRLNRAIAFSSFRLD